MFMLRVLSVALFAMGCAQAETKADKAAPAPQEVVKVPPVKEPSPAPAPADKKARPKSVAKGPDAEVLNLLGEYRSRVPVAIKIRKRVISPYLAKEKVSEGELQWTNKLFRLELASPENSTLVVDEKNIWVENRLEKELGGKTQVSRFPLHETRRANAIFAILFDEKSLSDGFRLAGQEKNKLGHVVYTYTPLKPAEDYTEIKISVQKSENRMVQFAYKDALENEVIYDFGETRFEAPIKKWQLEYTPPRGVKINEF